MPLHVLVRRIAVGTTVTIVGGAIALRYMAPTRENGPVRNPSYFNSWNLGLDKFYYHFGPSIRKLRDAEAAHVDAVKVLGSSRTFRGIIGCLPPQFDYSNLHSEPFNEQSRKKGGGGGDSTQLKRLHFNNPIGLAAGWDKNAQVRFRSIHTLDLM